MYTDIVSRFATFFLDTAQLYIIMLIFLSHVFVGLHQKTMRLAQMARWRAF